MRRISLALFAFTLACLPLIPAFAGDEAQEDTDAGRLFREAWWSETGAGALDKAVEVYRRAVSAEGSAAIRARAQYRLAIVLQRMGRAEEAVRALESLAKDFGGQGELLRKARRRLDEWTAEDLRESFGDWYRRYQYSPEFQSKIVDLILKLGVPDANVGNAARDELLTIGKPALAALREHESSANTRLRRAVVDLIIRLEELPLPDSLWGTSGWDSHGIFWKMLRRTEGAQRAAYQATAEEHAEDHRAGWVLAVLAGAEALLDVFEAETSGNHRSASYLLPAFYDMQPSEATRARLRALVVDPDVADHVRSGLASGIAARHDWNGSKPDPTGFRPGDLLQWAASDSHGVREVAWRYMAGGYLEDPDAWRVPAARVGRLTRQDKDRSGVLRAFLGQLRLAPVDVVPPEAVAAMKAYLESVGLDYNSLSPLSAARGTGYRGSAAVPRAVVAQAIATARGQTLLNAVQSWWQAVRQDPAEMPVLVGWVKDAEEGVVRKEALTLVGYQFRQGVSQLMAAFAGEQRRIEMRVSLMNSLVGNPALESLDWDRESLTRLVETADSERSSLRAAPGRTYSINSGGASVKLKTRLDNSSTRLFIRLLQDEHLRGMLFDAAAAAPERFTPDVWLVMPEWHAAEANRAQVIGRLDEAWGRWTPEQRAAGLRVLLAPQLVGRNDPQVDLFLRRALGSENLDLATRRAALNTVSQVTLADLQAAYDFSVPKEAAEAVIWLTSLPSPLTEKTYDAVKGMLTPTASPVVAREMLDAFRDGPKSRYADLIGRLLRVEGNESLAKSVVEGLGHRAEYLPLWRQALAHYSPDVRATAAATLGHLYDDASIKALANAVDDPNPNVRDAALKSLERIEKIEAQKKRWRQFAEGRAPGPGEK